MTLAREFDNEELATIVRALSPHVFLADPPERWMRDVLLRQIRVMLSENNALPDRSRNHTQQRIRVH